MVMELLSGCVPYSFKVLGSVADWHVHSDGYRLAILLPGNEVGHAFDSHGGMTVKDRVNRFEDTYILDPAIFPYDETRIFLHSP